MTNRRKDTSKVTQILKPFDESAGAKKEPIIVVVSGNLLDIGRFIQISDQPIVVGRDPNSDFTLNDEQISRRHLRISDYSKSSSPQTIVVEDLQSTNGTTLNGTKIQKSICTVDETIGLGETVLLFKIEDVASLFNPSNPLQLVTRDPLTGIYNRRAFEQIIKHTHNQARRSQKSYCLMVLDVDHFKEVNDLLGHSAGDEVLKRIVLTLSKEIRGTDVIARLGGEEFVLLLPGSGIFDGYIVAERLRNKIASLSFDDQNPGLRIKVSIGIAECNLARISTEELFNRADMALLRAKKEGRNRTIIASSRDGDDTTNAPSKSEKPS